MKKSEPKIEITQSTHAIVTHRATITVDQLREAFGLPKKCEVFGEDGHDIQEISVRWKVEYDEDDF